MLGLPPVRGGHDKPHPPPRLRRGARRRVHPSNYRITGFTAEAPGPELALLARSRGVPYLHDLGSGTFGPLPKELGGDGDPIAALAEGADLVCFSGDKLLGGPQAGILLGSRELVDRLAAHPLARALRVGKLTLAALERTLLAYRSGHADDVPVSRMLNLPLATLEARAHVLTAAVREAAGEGVWCDVITTRDPVGGGSHPGQTIEGAGVCLASEHVGCDQMAARLRALTPPIVAVIAAGRLQVHLRTVHPSEDHALAQALAGAAAKTGG